MVKFPFHNTQVQPERRDLIKAILVTRKKGMDAKEVDRNLIIGTSAYHDFVDNIPKLNLSLDALVLNVPLFRSLHYESSLLICHVFVIVNLV